MARVLTWLAWAHLAAVCAVAAVMWGLGDRWWVGTVLLFMGRWVFLLPLALLVPAALVVRRALLLPLLLAAIVTLGPIMGLRTGWRGLLPQPEGPSFRVVTFNVAGERGAGGSVAFLLPVLLDEWEPDVVAIQECGHSLGEAMAAAEGWHHHAAAGLCLLSRHPIQNVAIMDRRAIARMRQDAAGVGGAGFVVRYTLDTPAGPVGVTNLHLETPRKGLQMLAAGETRTLQVNTLVRDFEADMARRWVDAGRQPAIVAGDFNTPVESRIFQTHWRGLTNAFSHAGVGFGMTKHNGWIRARIDHVLAGPGWHVRAARVDRDLGSDHRPLVVDLVRTAR